MTHSIPEPNALLVKTKIGTVLHTGDWKLDKNPVVGRPYDRQRLQALRHDDLLAVVCDSTNAVVPGSTGSEGDLFDPLKASVEDAEGRVIVTSFASNVARLVTLARVAAATARRFGVIGAAMQRMVGIAQSLGYWPDELPALVPGRDLGYLPREEILAACTGSQGEPRSALSRLANDSHRDLALDPGDTVIFSSRMIPGNEQPVERLMQRLRDLHVDLVTDQMHDVHVSGHPAADDLRALYQWIAPRRVIPVHGTPRHLGANAAIARESGAEETLVIRNGDVCRLDRTQGRVIGTVENGRLSPDRAGLLCPVGDELLAQMRSSVC
jgi:ribonuclease J